MKKDILYFTQQFLAYRPMFFSYLRPFEANLFYERKNQFKDKILDYGCGDGFFANLIFNEAEIDYGLDVGSSRINEAKKIKCYKDLLVYDGQKIPLKDQEVNTVISNSVLEHIPDINSAVKEIERVLKPGGMFFTTVMTANWGKSLWGNQFWSGYEQMMKNKQEHHSLLSISDWEKVFLDSGFKLHNKITYLPPNIAQAMDRAHYLSIGSLFSYKLIGKWVIWSNWYRLIQLDLKLAQLAASCKCGQNEACACFFALQKMK